MNPCKIDLHRLRAYLIVSVGFNYGNQLTIFVRELHSYEKCQIQPKTFDIIYFQFSCKLFISSSFAPELTCWHKCTPNATVLNGGGGNNKFIFFLFTDFVSFELCVSRVLSPFAMPFVNHLSYSHSKTTNKYTN